jgi:hypothetical protein
MEVTIYQEIQTRNESLDHFIDLLYSSQMKFLASELLQEGLSVEDISDAVKRAVTIARTAKLNIREHFSFVYTQLNGQLVKDCKLTKLGYALVLINARPDIKLTSTLQLKLLNQYLR